jgi:hypothetical protein
VRVKGERRNGRPRLDDQGDSVRVSFPLPSRQYDAVSQRAQRERMTVSGFIRHRVLRPERDDKRNEDQ